MKYAIISDVHSNYAALKLVLQDIEQFSVDGIFNLGDVVGYGNEPAEVIELLRENGVRSVMGNHDYTIVSSKFPYEYTLNAQEQIENNKGKLNAEHIDFLDNLPDYISEKGMRMVHGIPPDDINVYIDYCSSNEINNLFNVFDEHIAFVGHTHRFKIFKQTNSGIEIIPFTDDIYNLGNSRAIINAGSVGLPRDGDNRPGYIIYDPDNNRVIKRRVT